MMTLKSLRIFQNESGFIHPLEWTELPFEPKRMFFIHGVPEDSIRGNHAHRTCHQLLFCTGGSLRVTSDGPDGSNWFKIHKGLALYAPPLHWLYLEEFGKDTSLIVLASHLYDPGDYIHEREEWTKLIGHSVSGPQASFGSP